MPFDFTEDLSALELPSGQLSEVALGNVLSYLGDHVGYTLYAGDLVDAGVQPYAIKVTGKGDYVGMLTKRLSKYLFKVYGYKTPPDVPSEVGNLICQGTSTRTSFTFDFTQNFDWNDGDFGDEGSCFWNQNDAARSVLESEGCWAIRFYDEGEEGYARAWIARPGSHFNLRVVFNAYGLDAHVVARVLAAHLGMSYRSCDLSNEGLSFGLIYINSGRGYLIGPPGDLECLPDRPRVDLRFGRFDRCSDCEQWCPSDEMEFAGDSDCGVSQTCAQYYEPCGHCGTMRHSDSLTYFETVDMSICGICEMRYYGGCHMCGEIFNRDDLIEHRGHPLCADCLESTPQEAQDEIADAQQVA